MVEVPGSSPVVPTTTPLFLCSVYDGMMPQTGHRLPKSEATRLKLLACAVEEIITVGPDRLGFTSIARRAGLSTGALYARYENVDELLLEVWMAEGLPTLRRLLADLEESLLTSTGKAARRRLAESVCQPSKDLLLLVNLLIVSRRIEAVYEEIAPIVTEEIVRYSSRVPAIDFFLGDVLGISIGVAGTGLAGLDWYGPVSMASSATRESLERIDAPVEAQSIPESVDFPQDAEDIDMRLFDAVAHVVAKVGAAQATISRIARRAKVNPASIYMRYEDKDALFAACMSFVMKMGTARNATLLKGYQDSINDVRSISHKSDMVVMFRGNQSPEHQSIRRLRVETMFASMHDASLRQMNQEIYFETLAGNEDFLKTEKGTLTNPLVLPYAVASRFAFFGYATLNEYGLCGMDHPYLISFFEKFSHRLRAIGQGTGIEKAQIAHSDSSLM
jgi:AcrR family transcriptional regulator